MISRACAVVTGKARHFSIELRHRPPCITCPDAADLIFRPDFSPSAAAAIVPLLHEIDCDQAPAGASKHSFNEILALYKEGTCGMWADATIAASFIADPRQSEVADKVAFAQASYSATPKGATWLWSWSLAIPAGTKRMEAAHRFVTWATSKE